jgi:hypothetical protein
LCCRPGNSNRQLIHIRGVRQSGRDVVPRHDQLVGRRRLRVLIPGFLKARLDLFGQFLRVRRYFLVFEHDERALAVTWQIVEERRRARLLGQRHDRRLIERLNRALC